MASYDYDIVNLALVKIGAKRITSLSETSKNAQEANAIYSDILKDVLRSHPWKFATRRATLKAVVANPLTITGVTQANPGVVTYTGTDPEDGDEYSIASVGGMTELNGNTYVIQSVNTTADTFQLYDTNGDPVNTTAYGAYTAGGTATEVIPHTDEWDYAYERPSDCLKVIKINDNEEAEYAIFEDNRIYYNENSCEIVYITYESAIARFDNTFINAFACRLAAELAISLTGKADVAKFWAGAYELALSRAEARDSQEMKYQDPRYCNYIEARR